jgi:hypothetical protein
MKVTVDTNVLVRACVQDDARQAQLASEVLRKARLVAVSSTTLCEFVCEKKGQTPYIFSIPCCIWLAFTLGSSSKKIPHGCFSARMWKI